VTSVVNAFWKGQLEYSSTAEAMLAFTDNRHSQSEDALWFLEHPQVYTRGTSCRTEVVNNPKHIPVVQSNRGGQLTYHGPGQLIVYLLLDIKQLGLGPKKLVQMIEQSIIDLLFNYGLNAQRRVGAPGVYIDQRKIAALGLRIRNGKCFHGLSLNVDMDLSPFKQIEPCGIPQLEVTQLSDNAVNKSVKSVAVDLLNSLQHQFNWGPPPVLKDSL